nr:hypothetical protein [Gammaproteobacteria bacterium]
MPDRSAVPMIVITTQQDHVEAMNSALRNAGHAVHCTWISDARDLADAFLQTGCELVLLFADSANASLRSVISVRDQVAPAVPVLVARTGVDEAVIAEAMSEGARDVVSLEHTNRLQSVVTRELR